jgi:hypothetical protein
MNGSTNASTLDSHDDGRAEVDGSASSPDRIGGAVASDDRRRGRTRRAIATRTAVAAMVSPFVQRGAYTLAAGAVSQRVLDEELVEGSRRPGERRQKRRGLLGQRWSAPNYS